MKNTERFIHICTKKNDSFPNNDTLPVVILQSAVKGNDMTPENFEKIFTSNGWPAAWRNGIFNFHHFHSTAHEVLGIYSGWIEVCFGGPGGKVLKATAGDIIVIPAGVSHCNKTESGDFRVVGAYPKGQRWDMRKGTLDELPEVLTNIKAVPLPICDPFYGVKGPLLQLWRTEGTKQ